MRNLLKVASECMKELDTIGIEYGKIVKWEINTRAKKRWGQCRKVPNGFSININSSLLEEESCLDGLKGTIMHELLHTCKGCFNHGAEWKRLASIVKSKYGYDIKRTSSADEKGVTVEYKPVRYKYIVKCTECGQEIKRMKRCKIVDHPDWFLCGKCNGHFKILF